MRKPEALIQPLAAAYFALCDIPGQWTMEHREGLRLAKQIAEAGFCPHCAAEDGSLQRLFAHEESQNPDEYGGSECSICEEFVVWGPQCQLEYVWADDGGHSDADPGL